MRTVGLIAIAIAALVLACTSNTGGRGGESNFVECRVDADCPRGACVAGRCDGDAGTSSSSGGSAGQVGATGGVSASGGVEAGGMQSSGGSAGAQSSGGSAGAGGGVTLDAGVDGALCERGACNTYTEGVPAAGCCFAANFCGFDYGYGCTDTSIPYDPDAAKAYLFPVDCNLEGQTFPCHPWSNVGCVTGDTTCVPTGANEETVACVQYAGPLPYESCTPGDPSWCDTGSGCSPLSLRCRPFCCNDSLCPPGMKCVDMDPSTPSPFGYCEE